MSRQQDKFTQGDGLVFLPVLCGSFDFRLLSADEIQNCAGFVRADEAGFEGDALTGHGLAK